MAHGLGKSGKGGTNRESKFWGRSESLSFALVSAYPCDMDSARQNSITDWSACSLVEINPRKVSGVPIVKGTRVQADSIVENYEGGSPVEEIAENFAIPESTIRDLLAYAASKQKQAQL
jgi:uncharacterized protein (DUF433 family)